MRGDQSLGVCSFEQKRVEGRPDEVRRWGKVPDNSAGEKAERWDLGFENRATHGSRRSGLRAAPQEHAKTMRTDRTHLHPQGLQSRPSPDDERGTYTSHQRNGETLLQRKIPLKEL